MMFSWTEKELNSEQTDAILEAGSVFLVACPGSGKTRALTYKIAYELSKLDSDRKFVVAITYTHRAADEIKDRIESLGVDISQLWIGTIHSFCIEWILKPYSIYQPELAYGYRIIDLHEREKLFERLCMPYKAHRITFYDCEYYLSHEGYHLGCSDTRKHQYLNKIIKDYFNELSTNRQIDFELILWYSYNLIESRPEISKILSQLFPMILVDEYQDTKQIQYSIITSILRAGTGSTRLFMVGDPNQAIYGSLGGYPITVQELKTLSQIPVAERALIKNYRSSSRIIDYFGNFNVYNTSVTPDGAYCNYPSLITYNRQVTRDNLCDEISKLISYNIEKLGVPQNEICVLAPQWFPLAAMTRKLVVQMPEYSFDGPGMVPFARDIDNFWYKLARLALTEPSPSMYIRRLRWAREILAELEDAGAAVKGLSSKDLLRFCNTVNVTESEGLAFLRRFFNELFSLIHINFNEFQQLAEHYKAFFESSESRIARLEREGINQIGDLSFFKKIFQHKSGITVSTIHGSKGAEFDVVIAFALLDGMIPHFNDNDGDISARKMLYVASSRARKNLHLFSESGRKRRSFGFYSPTPQLSSCTYDYN